MQINIEELTLPNAGQFLQNLVSVSRYNLTIQQYEIPPISSNLTPHAAQA